jgi:hypothetical protein
MERHRFGFTQREVQAEREGFEPSVRFPLHRFSRPARSTTPAPLRERRRAVEPGERIGILLERHANRQRGSLSGWIKLAA